MSNKKQSSIEWFAMMLAEQGLLVTNDYENLVTYKEAKAMHENDMKSFAIKAVSMAVNADIDNPYNLDELYKQTFGGQDNE